MDLCTLPDPIQGGKEAVAGETGQQDAEQGKILEYVQTPEKED